MGLERFHSSGGRPKNGRKRKGRSGRSALFSAWTGGEGESLAAPPLELDAHLDVLAGLDVEVLLLGLAAGAHHGELVVTRRHRQAAAQHREVAAGADEAAVEVDRGVLGLDRKAQV